MTPAEQLEAAHDSLAKASEHLRETEVVAMTAKRARKKIAATATADEVKKTILADECAAEMLEACRRGLESASTDVIIAEKRIEQSEKNERRRLQHERGVLPIRAIQAQVNAAEAHLAALRGQQTQIFLREVAPRNDEWVPTSPFSQPPPHTFLSVGHVIEAGLPQPKEKEPLPPSTLQPKSGAPLTQEERFLLLFCLDLRGADFCSDAQLKYGVSLQDCYQTAGDPRFGGEAVRDPELLASLRDGLVRAVNIAGSVRGTRPDEAWATHRMQQIKGWVHPTGPTLPNGQSALGAGPGGFHPEA
jgi:hypothetical protein